LLEADNFSATHSFEFGARVRDYGYWPETRAKKVRWFVEALRLARKHAVVGDSQSFARSKIAAAIRAVWVLGPDVQQEFEDFANDIESGSYWHEGWIAVRNALAMPKNPGAEGINRLRALEEKLKPKNIEQHVRALVLTKTWSSFDYAEMDRDEDEDEEAGADDGERLMRPYERASALAEELGKEVANDAAVFDRLLPDLVSAPAQRITNFGIGLATASSDPRTHWSKIGAALARTPAGQQNGGALVGFLVGLKNTQPELCEALLEEAVADENLASW
jgi:hypothetical protein